MTFALPPPFPPPHALENSKRRLVASSRLPPESNMGTVKPVERKKIETHTLVCSLKIKPVAGTLPRVHSIYLSSPSQTSPQSVTGSEALER